MKALICVVLLSLILLVDGPEAADDWTQHYPALKPSVRRAHEMAYVGGDHVILFGGWAGSSYYNDTWVYDVSAATWTQQNPATKPSGRYYPGMAHIGGGQALLFGGYDGPYDDETWLYDLSANTWTQQNPATRPSVRADHAMAYVGGDQALLFGGYNGSYLNDTWVYDLSANSWTQQNPATKPSARQYSTMAYIGADQVLLFGGWDASINANSDETWLYDLSANTWTQQNLVSKPSPRCTHGMVYIGGDQVMLFGGGAGGAFDDTTWVYDLSDNEWTQDLNSTQPSGRGSHGMAESSMDGSSLIVLFGGSDASSPNTDETWTFGGGDYIVGAVEATIDIEPYVLNLTIVSRWITCYIELPEECLPGDIDAASVALVAIDGQPINPIYRDGPTVVGDHDDDDIPDLMVKFDRRRLVHILSGMIVPPAVAELTVTGELAGGQVFEGSDSVWVVRFGPCSMEYDQRYAAGSGVLDGTCPNPVASETEIRYTVLDRSYVTLRVYDFTGRLVRTLVKERKPAGVFTSQWDGRDERGEEAPSGVYFYRFESGDHTSTSKLILAR